MLTEQVVPWTLGLIASPGSSSVCKASAGSCAAWVAGLAKVAPWAPPALGFDLPSIIAPVVVSACCVSWALLNLRCGMRGYDLITSTSCLPSPPPTAHTVHAVARVLEAHNVGDCQ